MPTFLHITLIQTSSVFSLVSISLKSNNFYVLEINANNKNIIHISILVILGIKKL